MLFPLSTKERIDEIVEILTSSDLDGLFRRNQPAHTAAGLQFCAMCRCEFSPKQAHQVVCGEACGKARKAQLRREREGVSRPKAGRPSKADLAAVPRAGLMSAQEDR